MLGTLLNCAGILLGGIAALAVKADLSQRRQLLLRILVGTIAAWFGFQIAGKSLIAGNWSYAGKLFLILIVSMIAGRLLGRLLHIQAGLNRAGAYAKERLASKNPNDGLLATAVLFSAAPLGLVGALEDGLANQFRPLIVKGLIDGLGAYAFVRMFGWRVLLAVLPVAGLQVTVAYGGQTLSPWLEQHNLLDPIHVVCGFIVIYVSLIIFEVKKVELGDYLPAIAVAPALAWLFH